MWPHQSLAQAHASTAPIPLGISWPTWSTKGYDNPKPFIKKLKALGFQQVILVPTYTYTGLNRIDFTHAPSWDKQQKLITLLLQENFTVVYKAHLDAPLYQPGFDIHQSDNISWRANCGWRGFFDVDPMSESYHDALIRPALTMIGKAYAALIKPKEAKPLRFHLGAELMNSVVYHPQRWLSLARNVRKELRRLKLQTQVRLSHSFSHHFLIPGDFVDRMNKTEQRTLARYLQSLDAIGISQYMDLTIHMPLQEQGSRMPSADEIAKALHTHESNLVEQLLSEKLRISKHKRPELHIDEFGIGAGGLKRPSYWEGNLNQDQYRRISEEIAQGFAGMVAYLRSKPRYIKSLSLWSTSRFFDIFGLLQAKHRIPAAAKQVCAYLKASKTSAE